MSRIRFSLLLSLTAFTLAMGAGRLAAAPIFLGETTGQPADLNSVFARLTTQIGLYNASHEFDLPTAIYEDAIKVDGQSGKKNALDVTGWGYLVLKAGPKNFHYYVGDDSGYLTFTTSKALSNYSFFKAYTPYVPPPPPVSVPDAGGSVLLVSAGLAGLGMVHRSKRTSATKQRAAWRSQVSNGR